MCATKVEAEAGLGQILKLVEQAQSPKVPGQRRGQTRSIGSLARSVEAPASSPRQEGVVGFNLPATRWVTPITR